MILELTVEQDKFRAAVDTFAATTVAGAAARIDETGEFPREIIRQAAARGLLGMTTSAEWGGLAREYVSYSLAIESIARASATVAAILVVANSLVAEVIERFGSDDQKRRWLKPLATGDTLGAFALSEEGAGTDAANQQTVAAVADGAYRLRGRKVWVANAEAANVAIVFASTQPGTRALGVTAFLVPLDSPGLQRIPSADTLGVRGLGCMDLVLDDVRVGAEQMLGAANEGFKIAMWALDGGRVGIAAQALGIGEAALEEALTHSRQRYTFGQPIASHQGLQWMLADIATELEAARMLTLKAADAKDRQDRSALEAAMAKLYASEAAHRAADKAMQILASAGYRRGSTIERLFRDVRATEIYQGTSEAQRMVIAANILP
jgi:butyryl-CoA dehydrogenase